jgi:hypothetical protein
LTRLASLYYGPLSTQFDKYDKKITAEIAESATIFVNTGTNVSNMSLDLSTATDAGCRQ